MGDDPKALNRCILELRQMIQEAEYLDFDEIAVQSLETAIESMQMRMEATPPQPVTPAGGEVVYQMMAKDSYVNADGHEVHDDPKLWMDADKENYERLRSHPSVRTRILYTHPPVADAALVESIAQAVATELYGEQPVAGSGNNSLTRSTQLPSIRKAIDAALNQRGGG